MHTHIRVNCLATGKPEHRPPAHVHHNHADIDCGKQDGDPDLGRQLRFAVVYLTAIHILIDGLHTQVHDGDDLC